MAPPPVALVVRLPPRLHYRARLKALRERTSLNKLLIAALTAYLRPTKGKGTV